jgi:peptide chain release factor 1
VLFAHHLRIENPARRVQRVDGGVDAEFRNRAAEHRGRVEVAEGRRGRGVREVVGGHVDRLDGGDRSLLGRSDPLLKFAHVGRERRLVADRGRNAPEQRRNLGAGLGEAEDVVDEEQDVLALRVAEVLRNRQRREPDARTRSGRLVHLAEHECGLFEHRRPVRELGVGHLVPEVVALAGPLAHAAEHRVTRVLLRDVGDQFEDDDRLADARASEQADLAALRIGGNQIDDLDAGFEGFDRQRLVDERGRGSMDRMALVEFDRPALVHGVADHVHDPAERSGADGHRDRLAGVLDRLIAHQAVRRVHRDAANRIFAEMHRHLDHEVELAIVDPGIREPQRGVELGKQPGRKLHVHHGSHHLYDSSVLVRHLPS